jgi:hypothetical protein
MTPAIFSCLIYMEAVYPMFDRAYPIAFGPEQGYQSIQERRFPGSRPAYEGNDGDHRTLLSRLRGFILFLRLKISLRDLMLRFLCPVNYHPFALYCNAI